MGFAGIDVPLLQQNHLLAEWHQLGGHYADPPIDALCSKAQQSFDSEQKIELLAQAHAIVVDEAAWPFMVHDLNPRAMSPKGFQPAQSWYQDFTKVTVE